MKKQPKAKIGEMVYTKKGRAFIEKIRINGKNEPIEYGVKFELDPFYLTSGVTWLHENDFKTEQPEYGVYGKEYTK